MIARLLHRITGSLPCRIISDGDQPYLERYYVGTLFGWRFYLHRFVESDPDAALFVPYRYQHEGNEKPEQWWKAAPLGRNESRRYPA